VDDCAVIDRCVKSILPVSSKVVDPQRSEVHRSGVPLATDGRVYHGIRNASYYRPTCLSTDLPCGYNDDEDDVDEDALECR